MSTELATTSIEPILIVEDSPEDFEALKRGLRKSGLANPLFHCIDGDQALAFLRREGDYANSDTPRPGLVLLDLNMPGTDGREVLKEMKSNPGLCSIPVIVLTTSSVTDDINRCYALGANSYVQKPVSINGLMEAVARITDFWFGIVLLPRPEVA